MQLVLNNTPTKDSPRSTALTKLCLATILIGLQSMHSRHCTDFSYAKALLCPTNRLSKCNSMEANTCGSLLAAGIAMSGGQ